jgi:hypothetical protein
MKKSKNNLFQILKLKFFNFHKREVRQFNTILGIKTGTHSKKC